MWVVTMIAIAAALGVVVGLVQSVRDCFEDEEVLLRITINLGGDLKSSSPPSAHSLAESRHVDGVDVIRGETPPTACIAPSRN